MSLNSEILTRVRKRLAEAQADLKALKKNPGLSTVTVRELEEEIARYKQEIAEREAREKQEKKGK